MSNNRLSTRQKKVKSYKTLPNSNLGNIGDMVLAHDSGNSYLGVKGLDSWKYTRLSSIGDFDRIIGRSLDISGPSFLKETLTLGSDLITLKDIYLRGSKIYFDSSATTPNDYITGGGDYLNFYAGGNNILRISSSQASIMDGYSLTVNAGDKLYLDGASITGAGVDTYITGSTDHTIKLYCGTGVLDATNDILTAVHNSITIDGSLIVNTITETTSDTDKILVSDSGTIKYVAGNTLLPDILTAGTNCTLSTATLNVDDAFIVNNADDTMAGTLTIDKDSTATSSASTKAMIIDFDHTGITATGQTIYNYGLDIEMNCDSVTHVGSVVNTGIDIDLVALTDGAQYNTGININCSGADTNTGLYIATADTHIKLAALADPITDYATIAVADTGDLTIATEGDGTTDSDLILDADGDIFLDAAGELIVIKGNGTVFGTFDTATSSTLKLKSTINYHLNLVSNGTGDVVIDSNGDVVLDSADGNFLAKKAGTEFSAANSSYAGMILGYTDIGLNETHAYYNLTTSFVVPTDEFSVAFTIPPSGNVLIELQVHHYNGSGGVGDLYAGLSTANATSGYSALASYHEVRINDAQGRGAIDTISLSWTLTGLTAGDDEEIWAGFKAISTTGTPTITWGGDATGRYPDFIMKATALPATITT